jgi:hypothetical protein
MRLLPSRFGLALLALVLAPLLGTGSRAQAGYLVIDPALRTTFFDTGRSNAGSGMTGAAEEKEAFPRRVQEPNDRHWPLAPSCPGCLLRTPDLWWMGIGQSGSGAGGVSTLSVTGGSGLHAAVGAKLTLPPLQAVGWLYIDAVESRPPPFPSRLFRPPRGVV